MEEIKYKITAKNVVEFEQIKHELEKLPPSVLNQIAEAERKMSYIHCKFFQQYNETVKINIPNDVFSIEVGKDGFASYNKTFRFEVIKSEKQTFNFTLTPYK